MRAAGAPRPARLSASRGNGRVTLSWTAASDGAAATGWNYRFGPDGGDFGSWQTMSNTNGATTTYSVTTGLTNGTLYRFQVRAVNANGPGPASDSDTARPVDSTVTKPGRPTGLNATAGNGRVVFRWDAIEGPDEWEVRRAQQGGNWGNWTSLGENNNATGATVTGLSNGTTYTFQVRALVLGNNGAASSTVSAKPLGVTPGIPLLTAAQAEDGSLRLIWSQTGQTTGWEAQYGVGRNPGLWSSWTPISGVEP